MREQGLDLLDRYGFWNIARADSVEEVSSMKLGAVTGRRGRVGIGKLHSPLGQCGEMRSLVNVAGRVRITIHHADRGVRLAEVIGVDNDEVGRFAGCGRDTSERGDQKVEESKCS